MKEKPKKADLRATSKSAASNTKGEAMARRKGPNLPLNETALGNKIAETIKTIIPPLEMGTWQKYDMVTEGYSVAAKWNENCDEIIIRLVVTP